jgi:hypothetical protein
VADDTNTLRARIASELNRALADSFANSGETVATVVNREINSAIKHYESTRFRWNEVFENEFGVTVSGTRVYTSPASFVRIDTLKLKYNSGFIDLKKRSFEEIDRNDTRTAGTPGLPSVYCIVANQIRPFPTPNGAWTLVASGIKRFLPTSITDSTTTIVLMGGHSITVTTTTSHKNRRNGWTTDGEELIRARALASIEIFYLKKDRAIAEYRMLEMKNQPFLSIRERQVYERLSDETNDILATGRVRGYGL